MMKKAGMRPKMMGRAKAMPMHTKKMGGSMKSAHGKNVAKMMAKMKRGMR